MQITIEKIILEKIIKRFYSELFEFQFDSDDSYYLAKKLLRAVGYKNRQDFIQQQLKNKEFMQELKSRLVKDIECNSLDWDSLCVQEFKSLRKLDVTATEKVKEINKINESRIDAKEQKQMIDKLISQGYQVTKKTRAANR